MERKQKHKLKLTVLKQTVKQGSLSTMHLSSVTQPFVEQNRVTVYLQILAFVLICLSSKVGRNLDLSHFLFNSSGLFFSLSWHLPHQTNVLITPERSHGYTFQKYLTQLKLMACSVVSPTHMLLQAD